MEKREQMEVTETERKIIEAYRLNSFLQPAVRKILDVKMPAEDHPRFDNFQDYIKK